MSIPDKPFGGDRWQLFNAREPLISVIGIKNKDNYVSSVAILLTDGSIIKTCGSSL